MNHFCSSQLLLISMSNLSKLSDYNVSSCKCSACRMACMVSPCFGTPEDMQKLIDAGYQDRLLPTIYMNPETLEEYPVIAPIGINFVGALHRCTFLDSDMNCELHDKNLKPTEGKLAYHGRDEEQNVNLRIMICNTWNSLKGVEIVRKTIDHLENNIVKDLEHDTVSISSTERAEEVHNTNT